jgi:hypothetical protein
MLFLLCLITITVTSECDYKPLENGVLSWGLDFHGDPIPRSGRITYNGTQTLSIFNWYYKAPEVATICFQLLE